jgi:SPP1 gp7 family putative phage head morphogenesis protein
MFGPLAPIQPMPVDTPRPGEDRPEPRRFQYQISQNMPMGMPGTEGPGKLASFDTLRTIADYYSVARACIELRKAELRGIRWEIASTKNAAKAMRGDHAAMKDFAERQAKVTKFFRRPDPQYRDFSSWMDAAAEEIFVTDALCLFPHPSRVKQKGVLGSNLASLDLIDGSLIKPLVDIRGSTPQPPNPGFQQFLYGVPRVDLMTMVLGDDLPDAEGLAAEYRADQIMYLPSHPRTWTVYGFTAVERAIIPIMTGIAKQKYSLNYFSEGTIPGLFVSPGDANMTPSQIRELQDALNAIAGDQAWKHKIIVLPGGSKVDPQKPAALADAFDQIVMLQVCMSFDVMPMELGILPTVSATTTPSTVTMMNKAVQAIHQRKSTVPLLEWLKSAIFDIIVQDVLHQEDMEWRWEGLEENEDEEALTGLLVEQVGAGLASIDEARMELGREPWGLPMTQDPGWATQYGGFQPLTALDPTTAGGQMPGQGQKPSRPTEMPSPSGPGARTGEMPGELPPTGMTTRPRNAMGHGQRADHASRVGTARALPAGQTPAHSGAAAAHANTRRDGSTRKAAERELGLLRSHLRKGAELGGWERRALSGTILAMITEDITKGLSPDEACDVAAGMLGAGARKAAGYSLSSRSGMISLDLPEGTIQPVPGGVDDHHITIVYLGPDVDDEQWAYACTRAREAAASAPGPMSGMVSGIGSFPPSDSSDGLVPAWAGVMLPDASQLRGTLEDLSASEHATWAPHVTLAYIEPGEDLPEPVPATMVTFTHLSVHRGDDVERFPLGVGPVAKDAADLSDPNPVEAEHVANQMRANYPEKAIGWIAGATWIGPVEVPQDRVNFAGKDSWAASHEPGAVKRFASAIKHGSGHTHPVVMVQEPGEGKADVVDGHHRTLAYAKLGRPVKAYVGFVPEGDHRWRETHSFQVHQGASRANKAGGAGPKGPGHASGSRGNTAGPGLPLAAVPGPDASRGAGGSHRDDGTGGQAWPGWFSDSQLAAEYARTLTASLAAAVNAGNLARDWLALNAAHRRPPADVVPARRGKDRQAVRPAPLAWPAQKAQQPPTQQQSAQPAPRQFLAAAGVAAALTAALITVLSALWGAAWAIGWASASAVTGRGEIGEDVTALGAMLREGKDTRAGWILRTLLKRLEKLLLKALRNGAGEDELARQITDLLDSLTAALLITQSETTWAIGQATLAAYIKAGITYKKWVTRNDDRVCGICKKNQAAGPIPIMAKFPNGSLSPLAHPACRCIIAPGTPPALPAAGKSAQTPIVSTVHHPLGTEGLWHTPDKHVGTVQQLPAYFQNTARALMRDQGMGEQQAIATAVNAVREWSRGTAFGGKVKVTEEVRQAAQRAMNEWEALRASHDR